MQTSNSEQGPENNNPIMPGGEEEPADEKLEPSTKMLREKPTGDKPIKPPRRGGGSGEGGDTPQLNKSAIAFCQSSRSSGLSRLKRQKERLGDSA
jgi:hypothetical protein